MIGRTLGHYRIVEKIGHGGMGEVYRARDEHLGRDVALKVLREGLLADEAARRRFRKEAEALSKLNHPNIQTVFDFDTQDGVDFLVTEYVPGVTLSNRLAGKALPEKDILRLGQQLAEGLAAAHEQGVIHRDLKPSNLRLTPDGRLKILDFGVAKLLEPVSGTAATASGTPTVAGTPLYMAPEQRRGEPVDARSDLYSAGLVLVEMAPGKLPAVCDREGSGKLSTLSPGLQQIIYKCCEDDPENRYQSAKELAVDLRRLATPTAIPLTPSPARPEPAERAAPAAGILATLLRSAQRLLYPERSRGMPLGLGLTFVAVALLLGLNVGGFRERLFGAPTPQIDSLAVLPLKNLSGDSEQEYFVEGMHEALTAELSKISALKVISRTSAMQYKDVKKPMPQIARELGVTGLIEGSVAREGDQVRITVQLIHGPTDQHLWAESYQRELRGILALQSEVARAIAREIQVAMTPEQDIRLAHARPVNPEAYNAYLQGRYFYERRTKEELERAVGYYEEAIQLDPNYAAAWAGLGITRHHQADWGYVTREEGHRKARQAVERALALDANLAEAHTAKGLSALYDWDWAAADASYQRALALEPGNTSAILGAAGLAHTLGRFEEAVALGRRAVELDPLHPGAHFRLGIFAYFAGQLEEAVAAHKKALELNPALPNARNFLGLVYLAQAHPPEALAEMEQEKEPTLRLHGLALAYQALGRKKESDAALAELVEKYQQTAAFEVAEVYAFRKEADRAFEWLERAYTQRDGGLTRMKGNPLLKYLERDPRYATFLKKMRLPT
ncbi:MAG: protein kinase [Acidobacteria bacterium]|nr:protein kinase [Acidobacteriota bacterium]